ncbi:MAG TPA: hypothetical protein VFU31_29890 [Candidatus Binatia bacterium]|nr:hypothetical protein [Candidatus Binatia bacterium]
MSAPRGPYTVWIDYGYEGWKFNDCRTLEEAIHFDGSYGSAKHISRPVKYKIEEIEEPDADAS